MARTRKYSRKRQNTRKRKLNRSRKQRNYRRRNYKRKRTLKQRGGASIVDIEFSAEKFLFGMEGTYPGVIFEGDLEIDYIRTLLPSEGDFLITRSEENYLLYFKNTEENIKSLEMKMEMKKRGEEQTEFFELTITGFDTQETLEVNNNFSNIGTKLQEYKQSLKSKYEDNAEIENLIFARFIPGYAREVTDRSITGEYMPEGHYTVLQGGRIRKQYVQLNKDLFFQET